MNKTDQHITEAVERFYKEWDIEIPEEVQDLDEWHKAHTKKALTTVFTALADKVREETLEKVDEMWMFSHSEKEFVGKYAVWRFEQLRSQKKEENE